MPWMVRVQGPDSTARGVSHGRTSLAITGRLLNWPAIDDGHPNKVGVIREVLDRYWPGEGTGSSSDQTMNLTT